MGLATGVGKQPLNVVLVVADDLGWADLGCYGADLHETPRIDALAKAGMRFTQAYSPSPVCTPTRASLLTGKHPARLGMTIWHEGALNQPKNLKLIPPESQPNLPQGEVTLAEALREKGYHNAIVGKWHLGDAGHYPEAQGFDLVRGGTFWGAPPTYFAPYRGLFSGRELRYVPGLWPAREGEYLTDRLTAEACGAVDVLEGQKRPWLLYLAHHAPHTPIEAPAELVKKYERKLRPGMQHTNATYAAMVESFDASVGRVWDYLRKRRLLDKTVVVVTSDNGGYLSGGDGVRVTSNAPLRSGKGSLYEGGIRVPLVVHWPGKTRPGSVSEEPVVLTDLFATLCEAGGAAKPAGAVDGMSLLPLLEAPGGKLKREELYFHYPHYYPTTTPVSAMRTREWKLLEYYEDGRLELYHLPSDPGEQRNRAAEEAGQARAMREKLAAWREKVGARMPRVNL